MMMFAILLGALLFIRACKFEWYWYAIVSVLWFIATILV
jgi:hypothetical protein